MKKLVPCLLFAAWICPTPSFADWKATIEIKQAPDHIQSTGELFASGNKMRMEISAQGNSTVIIVDTKGHTASMLMPAQKMAMEMPAAASDKQMMTCSTSDVDGCLKAKGFKKTGSDTVDGHPCAIYENDEEHGGAKMHNKLWRPTDLKEVFMIKMVLTTAKAEVITHLKNIQNGKLASSLFVVPADYRKMQMPDFGAMRH